jgi:hypothetical protein
MAQNNGLQPTQTFLSPAQLNKENAGKEPGKSFTDGQSGLIPGEIQESAGGDYANWSSNDSFDHPVPVKHGKSAVINSPDVVSTQNAPATPTIASAQQGARIGNTGPNVGSNDVGNIAIATFSTTAANELHVISGISFLGAGPSTITVTTNVNAANVVVSNTYSGATSFPLSTVNSSGAGWSAVGGSVTFARGTYSSMANASLVGLVPRSGADFFISYSYPTITPASTTASFTGVNGDLTPNYIPNVGNRFAR